MTIGTVTISGWWPAEIDGVVMPDYVATRRFAFTTDGMVRGGKLYKTFDPYYLADALGVRQAKISTTVSREASAT